MLAEKLFRIYERVAKKEFKRVTTLEMNILYNVSMRAKRDEKYLSDMNKFDTGMGDTLINLIDKFFEAYNVSYGLDIRDSLVLYDDDDMSGGCYFTVETFKSTKDGVVPHPATEFMPGDKATVKFTLKSRDSDTPKSVSRLGAMWRCGTETGEKVAENTANLTVDFTLSKPGYAFAKVVVFDESGKAMSGCDTGFGGVLFDRRGIVMDRRAEKDIEDFWRTEIERLFTVDPMDDTPSDYEGSVLYEFDMPRKNKHGIRRFDREYLDLLRDAGYTPPSEDVLCSHDSYEVYLKSPGPCHASGYLTLPRVEKKMPIHITYDGYSAYMPMPVYSDNEIRLHCTHHGYELAKPSEGYYKVLSGPGGICENYGRLNGSPNSDYNDPHDCYMTYFWLRNLQMLRYITSRGMTSEIEGLSDRWNGEIIFSGGSMGGYQASMMPALAELMKDKCDPFSIVHSYPDVPAMCNTKGCMGLTKSYVPEMDYFDPTNLAHLIKCPVTVTRASLGDEACPVPDIMTYYNALHAAKEIRILQNSSHGFRPEEDNQIWYIYKD